MTEETATVSHLSVVMTTHQREMMTTAGETGVTSSSPSGVELYFAYCVVVIGVIGAAANGLVLYALVASKQHKKHELIFNQNAIDLYTCLFLVITYGLKFVNVHLTGSLGYWLCMLIFSQSLFSVGLYASWINLMFISIERYLKVVHHVWSKAHLRKWMTYAAISCTWISGIIHEMVLVFKTSAVIDGVCYGYVIIDPKAREGVSIYYVLFTYVFVLSVSIFCYMSILMVIRRQARVMASHDAGGRLNAAQAQRNKTQANVIKTMILVCAFYAIAWLPEKIYILLMGQDLSLNLMDTGYYVGLFFGCFYICTNPAIVNVKRRLKAVR